MTKRLSEREILKRRKERTLHPRVPQKIYWTAETTAVAFKQYNDNDWSVGQTAVYHNSTPDALRKAFKRFGHPLDRNRHRTWDEERILKAYELYKSGLTMRQVGEHFGISGASIATIFMRSPGLCPPVRSGKLKVKQAHQCVTVDDICLGCGADLRVMA